MIKSIYSIKAALIAVFLFLGACASNGTGTLGNGKIDINLGDGKLFGSEKAYVIGITAAQIAVYKNPVLAFSVKSELKQAREKLVDVQGKFTPEQASSLVLEALLEECAFYCSTVAGQAYLQSYIAAAAEIADELSAIVQVTPVEYIDELLAQIELVERSSK